MTVQAEVQLAPEVFQRLRSVAPATPWVRLAGLVRRMRGDDQDVLSGMYLAAEWDPAAGTVRSSPVRVPARVGVPIFDWFRESFDHPDWVEVLITCDRDGRDAALVRTDPAGPPESDYVGGAEHPFQSYVDEHRAELEQLGRDAFG